MITTNAKPIYFDSDRPEVKKFHSTGLFGRVSLGCSTTVKCFDEKECKHGYCSIQSDAERICKCDRGWTGKYRGARLRQVSGINYLIQMCTYRLTFGDSEITWVG